MAVAFDAKMTAGNGTGGTYAEVVGNTSISTTGMTIGASATLLVVVITWGTGGGNPTGVSVTWNSVAMTAGPTVTNTSRSAIYTLVSPTTGNHTLALSWTNSNDCYCSCVSFSGTDTVTGIKTTDNATTTNATSLTITSDSSGATIAIYGNETATAPTTNFNQVFIGTDLTPNAAASYQIGGTSNVHTFTGSAQNPSTIAGVHIIAPGASNNVFEDDSYNSNLVQFIDPIVSVW